MTTEHPFRPRSFFRSPVGLVLLGFLAIAAFFLLTEHTAHVFGVLPYLAQKPSDTVGELGSADMSPHP